MDELWYLAHPYSVTDRGPLGNLEGERMNWVLANRLAWQLLKHGYMVYSPITHTYPIHLEAMKERIYTKAEEYEIYMPVDECFATRCDGLILANNWDTSKGCRIEKKWFEDAAKPILYAKELI